MVTALWCGIITLAALGSPLKGAQPVAPYFNGTFPANAPGSASGWTSENAFPNLTFVDPIWLAEVPGSNELMLITKGGQIWRFPNSPATTPAEVSLVLDLGPKLQISEDQGLYRLAFHPEFGSAESSHSSDVFICYSHRPDSPDAAPDKSMWRLSRFQWNSGDNTVAPASEEVLIQQYDPHLWHNGGALIFDNDGFLLITCGDGGGVNDQYALTQKINGGFFGGVLRIDVDNNPSRSDPILRQPLEPSGKPVSFPASFSQGYGVPKDNPWRDGGASVLGEYYALGLRSPHSANYDAETGDLWVGDVGQSQREELNLVTRGANYQWGYMEGTITGPKNKPTGTALVGLETPPVYTYDRTVGTCIIGGLRYRGAKWADDLGGQVIFGDNGKGTVSSATLVPGQAPYVKELASGLGAGIYSGIAGLCTDSAGEIYLMKLNGIGQSGGTIRKLVRASLHIDPPALLSATGLFSNLASLQPAPGLVPYEVASPLWSDGAEKKRWVILPNDG